MIDAHNLSMGCFSILSLFTYGGPDTTVSWEVKSMFTIQQFPMCVCVYNDEVTGVECECVICK